MTLTEKIKTTKTPQEALLLLAQAIDALRAEVANLSADEQKADPWQQPLDWYDPVVHAAHHEIIQRAPQSERLAQIEAVRVELEETTDPDERRMLEARLRLLADTDDNVVRPGVPDGNRVVEVEGMHAGSPTQAVEVGGNVVQLPVVSEGRKDARRAWASEHKVWEFFDGLDEEDFLHWYGEGGPMWLVLGARHEVLQMPYQWRVDMVEEIAKDSPAQAQEVARDILKSEDSITVAQAREINRQIEATL